MRDLGGLPHIQPMLAVPGTLPSLAADADYGYELKWDGIRAIAYLPGPGAGTAGGRLTLLSRNDNDITAQYPELAPLGDAADTPCVLDGEIIAMGPDGRPSFAALQRRMNLTRGAVIARLAGEVPVDYMIFDVLHLGDDATLRAPYRERRALLADLDLAGSPPDAARWRVPPHWEGGGSEALAMTRELHLEGLVGKRLTSAYYPGRRSDAWLKIKNVRAQEVLIGGWTEGEGSRRQGLGALLVGVESDAGLAYAGSVGTGFTERMRADLRERLLGLSRDTSPFAGPVADRHVRAAAVVHWVEPKLLGEVAFTEWTDSGRLRHPVWRGLRPDKQKA